MARLTLLLVFSLALLVPCIRAQEDTETEAPDVEEPLPESCAASLNRESGMQTILPQPGFGDPIEVYCDQEYDGGGWTVIQNRFEGSIYFYRGWADYENGFGNANGEFWLGLRRIHELTYSKQHELRVILEDKDGYQAGANYSHFLVAGPEARYKLERLGSYTGLAGDSLRSHLDAEFSTFDRFTEHGDDGGEGSGHDHEDSVNCAERFKSGWWFHSDECFESDLNGLYWTSETGRGMNWYSFRQNDILKSVRMMIRAK